MIPRAKRILRISRIVADLDRAEAFYRDALGFRRVASNPASRVMRLGAEEIGLVRLDPPGPAYPSDSRSNDLWFQHLAIVVDDMDAAWRHLEGFAPGRITVGGPQLLPPRNGGVVAVKFRDPDGHPLELLWFPPGQGRPVWHDAGPDVKRGPFLGIDHSAIAVSGTASSLRFYRSLGFRPAARSWNQGPAQARLDGLPDAKLRVTSLRIAGASGPGLELLAYDPPGRAAPRPRRAVTTDWVTLLCPSVPEPLFLQDPDGHLLLAAPG